MTTQQKAAPVLTHQGGQVNTNAGGANVRVHHTTTSAPRLGPRHGTVRGSVWCKTVRQSQRMLRKPPAWALDVADLDLAEAAGARWVALMEQERGITYRAPIERVRAKGIALDRGYGRQLALSLGHWLIDGQEPEPESERKAEPVQAVLL